MAKDEYGHLCLFKKNVTFWMNPSWKLLKFFEFDKMFYIGFNKRRRILRIGRFMIAFYY